jgi:hypothetical protein
MIKLHERLHGIDLFSNSLRLCALAGRILAFCFALPAIFAQDLLCGYSLDPEAL